MIVYVAAAIDRKGASESPYWFVRKTLADDTNYRDMLMFMPGDAFAVSRGGYPTDTDVEYLVTINEIALHGSDGMLVCYQPGIESWGVPQELLLASRWEKPIWVWSSVAYEHLPLYLRHRVPKGKVFGTLVAALDSINGYHRKNSDATAMEED
jgi:hypothetical protein